MTLSIQHPTAGKKALVLRGLRHPTLGDKAIASVRITHPTLGDKQIWDGTVLPSLTITASPTYVQGAAATNMTVPVSTNSTTVSVTGGTAPYSYSWASPDDPSNASAVSPTAAATNFVRTSVGPDTSYDFTMQCTVTDARGATGTVDVSATVTNYGKA